MYLDKGPVNPDDKPSAGWGFLGFILGFISIVLYVVWKSEYPRRSKSILKGFIVGIVFGAVVAVTIITLYFTGVLDKIFA